MAQILRWALEQPGFEQVFTRNEMYTMQPTNVQPVTRYFSQQDKMRIGSSRYYISSILGSKLGYTNTARYSYACLAEQDGVRLICVTMQSELSTDKYNDMRTLLDYAFSTFTGYTDLPAQGITAPLSVVGGGGSLGTVTVSDPGVRLLLANGLTADDVEVTLELPESYVLGSDPEVYAVYTVHGGEKQESTSVHMDAEISGLPELLENSTGQELEAAKAVKPQSHAFWLLGISLGCRSGSAGNLSGGAVHHLAEETPQNAHGTGTDPPRQISAKACVEQTFPDKTNMLHKKRGTKYGQVYVYSDRDPRCCGH